jgi:probable rRNA maturation factor
MKALVIDLFKKERTPVVAINYIFCSDEYLLQINQQFLQHDDYTDIITFDLSDDDQEHTAGSRAKPTTCPRQGEIYISVERVVENAKLLNAKREEELRRVMIHGCLHLCGYKDKLNEQKAIMRRKEDQYIRLYKQRST